MCITDSLSAVRPLFFLIVLHSVKGTTHLIRAE